MSCLSWWLSIPGPNESEIVHSHSLGNGIRRQFAVNLASQMVHRRISHFIGSKSLPATRFEVWVALLLFPIPCLPLLFRLPQRERRIFVAEANRNLKFGIEMLGEGMTLSRPFRLTLNTEFTMSRELCSDLPSLSLSCLQSDLFWVVAWCGCVRLMFWATEQCWFSVEFGVFCSVYRVHTAPLWEKQFATAAACTPFVAFWSLRNWALDVSGIECCWMSVLLHDGNKHIVRLISAASEWSSHHLTKLDATDVVSPQHFWNWCPTHDWDLSTFKHCLTGTFCHVSTVSLAPFFNSTLSQGHLPLCDIHTHTQPRHFQSLLSHVWVTFESLLSIKFGYTPLDY